MKLELTAIFPSNSRHFQDRREGMIMRAYLQVSGALFGLIALAHLHRLLRHWPVDLAGHVVPLWASWLGLLLAGGLSIWAFRLVRSAPRVT